MRFSLVAFLFSLVLAVGCGRNAHVGLQDKAAEEADAKQIAKIDGYWKVATVTFSSNKDHDVAPDLRHFDKGAYLGQAVGTKPWKADGSYEIKGGVITFKTADGGVRKTGNLQTLDDTTLVIQWLQANGKPVERGYLRTTFTRLTEKEVKDVKAQDEKK